MQRPRAPGTPVSAEWPRQVQLPGLHHCEKCYKGPIQLIYHQTGQVNSSGLFDFYIFWAYLLAEENLFGFVFALCQGTTSAVPKNRQLLPFPRGLQRPNLLGPVRPEISVTVVARLKPRPNTRQTFPQIPVSPSRKCRSNSTEEFIWPVNVRGPILCNGKQCADGSRGWIFWRNKVGNYAT